MRACLWSAPARSFVRRRESRTEDKFAHPVPPAATHLAAFLHAAPKGRAAGLAGETFEALRTLNLAAHSKDCATVALEAVRRPKRALDMCVQCGLGPLRPALALSRGSLPFGFCRLASRLHQQEHPCFATLLEAAERAHRRRTGVLPGHRLGFTTSAGGSFSGGARLLWKRLAADDILALVSVTIGRNSGGRHGRWFSVVRRPTIAAAWARGRVDKTRQPAERSGRRALAVTVAATVVTFFFFVRPLCLRSGHRLGISLGRARIATSFIAQPVRGRETPTDPPTARRG